ncbi:unnamed protein product [Merluccius merluccius]
MESHSSRALDRADRAHRSAGPDGIAGTTAYREDDPRDSPCIGARSRLTGSLGGGGGGAALHPHYALILLPRWRRRCETEPLHLDRSHLDRRHPAGPGRTRRTTRQTDRTENPDRRAWLLSKVLNRGRRRCLLARASPVYNSVLRALAPSASSNRMGGRAAASDTIYARRRLRAAADQWEGRRCGRSPRA